MNISSMKISVPLPLRALVVALLIAQPAWAEPVAQPAVNANMIAEMMSRQQQMQAELGELRDLVERQGHELDMLKRANKETYIDTDRRLSALETNGAPPAAAANTAVPSTAGTPPAGAVPPPAPVPVPVASADDQAKYDAGMKQLKAGQYEAAIKTFDQIVKQNPPSVNRPNALYWMGETYSVLGDLKAALSAFDRVVKEYPAHQKAADAQLKMGYIYYDQKNYAQAKQMLNKVKAQYPGTQAAALAEQRLKRMQTEGV